MSLLSAFDIPVSGLKIGVHAYHFKIDWRFFQLFDHLSEIQGRFGVTLEFDKQYDHWLLVFAIDGTIDTLCDRCLVPISMEISGQYPLIVKYSEDKVNEDDSEVEYVSREIQSWNAAEMICEFVLLSIPAQHLTECQEMQPKPCDEQLLVRLTNDKDETASNDVWDALKNIELKK